MNTICNKNIILKKRYIFFLVLASILFVFSFSNFYSALNTYLHNREAINIFNNSNSGDFQLVDSYDTGSSNIYDFFSEADSLKIMNDAYRLVSQNKNYFEISDQTIDFIGHSNLSKEFTDDGTSDQVNQKNESGEEFTALKAFQISERCSNYFHLEDKIDKGKYFDSWESATIVPVILGYAYSKKFTYGEKFNAYYLGSKKIACKVIGFFKKDTRITLDSEKINLNNYIVSQNMTYTKKDSDEYKKILMSVKCEGYMHYTSKEKREECLAAIQTISNQTGFLYDIPKAKDTLKTMLEIGYMPCCIIFLISIILLFITNTIYIRNRLLILDNSNRFKQTAYIGAVYVFAILIGIFVNVGLFYGEKYIIWNSLAGLIFAFSAIILATLLAALLKRAKSV